MAKNLTPKKTTKYELSRKNIAVTLSELIGKLEDADVMSTTPSDMEDILRDVVCQLESLTADIYTKA